MTPSRSRQKKRELEKERVEKIERVRSFWKKKKKKKKEADRRKKKRVRSQQKKNRSQQKKKKSEQKDLREREKERLRSLWNQVKVKEKNGRGCVQIRTRNNFPYKILL